ncbi:MAG: shikimate dehydrogenase [Luteitalea sp.]|nr:shikimate dehydrogenase [Luteitalea sp.]
MSTRPLLCVTVTAATTAELRQRRDAVTEADLIELRLDTLADPDAAGALAGRRRPVIVTCRPTWEGGQFAGAEEERRRLLQDALTLGAEYVDIEWKAQLDDILVQSGGRRIVLSFHDFKSVPADLADIASAMSRTGAEVIKIAAETSRLTDCLAFLALQKTVGPSQRKVLIAMGEAGLATRVLAARFGSAWSYAGDLRVAGQVTPSALLNDYHYRSVTAGTELYGLVGSPIAHSVSPSMHNAAFRAAEIDAVYLPLPTVDPQDFITFGGAMNVKGASVTIPHKVSLLERLDHADPVSRSVGAVNTVRVREGRWDGRNTDVAGFLSPLQERGIGVRGIRAAIVGAGGAARAVAVALASEGAQLTVHARDRDRAGDVAALGSARVGEWPPPPGSWDLLVNCTPVGMHPDVGAMPVPAAALTGRFVYDLIYNPSVTTLLQHAAVAGCETIGGLDMLVAQAREQFHWWTAVRPSADVMRGAAVKRLSEFSNDANHVI